MTRQPKIFYDLAREEQVVVKRKNEYVHQVVTDKPDTKFVTDEWLDEFFKIPAEHRCNPFDISPSGDLYFADKRNVEAMEKSIEQARNGQTRRLTKEAQKELFGL